ncbi:MAG: OB-fold nucleic acid binding domain-containing protein, partial [Acidimicrobiales bacterium]
MTAQRSGKERATTFAGLAEVLIASLPGVGARRQDALHQVGIDTVLDLVTHYPRRYVDRSRRVDIAQMVEGDEVTILASVRRSATRRTRARRTMVEVDFFDGTSYLRAVFFNQPWRAKQLREGLEALLFGKVERYRGRLQMTN